MSSPRPSDTVEPEPQRQSVDHHDERREERLRRRRQREKDRRARLLCMRQDMRQRVANETAEERETRLLHMRQRVANETADEREARLLQMRLMVLSLNVGSVTWHLN